MSEALGPMSERVKTDMRLPAQLVKVVEELCDLVGVKKNSFLVLALATYSATLTPLLRHPKKRAVVLRELRELFQKVIEEAEKTA